MSLRNAKAPANRGLKRDHRAMSVDVFGDPPRSIAPEQIGRFRPMIEDKDMPNRPHNQVGRRPYRVSGDAVAE